MLVSTNSSSKEGIREVDLPDDVRGIVEVGSPFGLAAVAFGFLDGHFRLFREVC